LLETATESADCTFGHMFGLTRSSTLRLRAVEHNAAPLAIDSPGLSLNLAVCWGGPGAVSGEGDGRLDDQWGIRKAGNEAEGDGPGLCASGWVRTS
jgi:hypothetical protein